MPSLFEPLMMVFFLELFVELYSFKHSGLTFGHGQVTPLFDLQFPIFGLRSNSEQEFVVLLKKVTLRGDERSFHSPHCGDDDVPRLLTVVNESVHPLDEGVLSLVCSDGTCPNNTFVKVHVDRRSSNRFNTFKLSCSFDVNSLW